MTTEGQTSRQTEEQTNVQTDRWTNRTLPDKLSALFAPLFHICGKASWASSLIYIVLYFVLPKVLPLPLTPLHTQPAGKKRQLSVFILGARVSERTEKNVPTNKISIYAIFPPFLQIQHIRPRNWNATTTTTTMSGGDRLTVWLSARQTTSIPSHKMKQKQQQQRAMCIWRVIC